MSRHRLSYAVVAVALIAALGGDALSFIGRSDESGRLAPALPREVLVPPRATIASLRGRPAAINFWASWCEPCRQEAAQFESLYRELNGRASLVGVNWEDDRDAAMSFIGRYGWTFPVMRAPPGSSVGAFGVVGLPTTVILNSDGRISNVLQGPQTVEDVGRALGLPNREPTRGRRRMQNAGLGSSSADR